MPKPGGTKELDVFQKQETSPCDNSVGIGRRAMKDDIEDVINGHHVGPLQPWKQGLVKQGVTCSDLFLKHCSGCRVEVGLGGGRVGKRRTS